MVIEPKLLRALMSSCLPGSPDFSDCLFLFGAGRSGTTWVSERINYDNRYRDVFEPFHHKRVAACRGFHFRQYLCPDEDAPEHLAVARQIVEGQVRGLWANKYNRRFSNRHRLIKDIRTPFLMGWLHRHFPQMKIILLMRHPCPVALSKIKLNWGVDLGVFLDQPALVEDYWHEALPQLNKWQVEASAFEKMIVQWCLEYAVPLSQFRSGGAYILFYEHLCLNPEEEMKRLFAALDLPWNEAALVGMGVPSRMSRAGAAASPMAGRVQSWRREVDEETCRHADEILAFFGLDAFYRGGRAEPVLPASGPAEEVLKDWLGLFTALR